jgi:Fe-S-cluster containining protein
VKLTVLNLESARFECTFGRGCDGVCCRNGRPPVYDEEARRIDAQLERIMPLLRPAARAAVNKRGYLSRRRKAGQPMARVVAGWCVFFNEGCTLHRLGAAEGVGFRYKPAVCAMFPLAKDQRDRWYVRQKGYKGEIWNLVCLDPARSEVPAAASLQEEIALVAHWTVDRADSRKGADGEPSMRAPPSGNRGEPSQAS